MIVRPDNHVYGTARAMLELALLVDELRLPLG